MLIATHTRSTRIPANPTMRLGSADPVAECDFCGRPVRRETAFERVHHGDDGIAIVFVCPECEHGED